jgi:nucleoside-diphosphate-sugar epimerase
MAALRLEDTMKIVVIGGTGFIGSSVVLGLNARGHDVAVFSRGERECELPRSVTHIRGDRDRLGDSREAIREFEPDAVVDFILFTEAQAQGLVDVMAPLVERIVGISSCDVYRNYDGVRGRSRHVPDPVPLAESAPLRENYFPYRQDAEIKFEYADDYEKILVEEVLNRAQDVFTTVLRLPAVYGPGDRQHRFGRYIRQMKSGADEVRFPADKAEWRFTHGFVENVAAAIAEATAHPAASDRTFNVGESVTPTFEERLEQLAVVAEWDGEIVPTPSEELPEDQREPGDWDYDLAIDTSRFADELDFKAPVDRRTALRRTVEWDGRE